MEGDLWSARSDVLVKVFLLLPLEDLLCIRLVCKSWHLLIGSSEFLNLWKRKSWRRLQQAWICVRRWRKCKSSKVMMQKLMSEAWCPVGGGKRIAFPFSLHPPNASQFQAMACSHGLVFGRSYCGNQTTLHVGNPLKASWRQLTLPYASVGCHQATMEVDSATGTYRIGLFGALPFFIYDSRADAWSSETYYRSGSQIHGRLAGNLYMDKLPNSVICYDLNAKSWSEAEVSGFPDKTHQRLDVMVCSSMFNHNGRHIRASALLNDNNKLWYEIWELEQESGCSRMAWKILSRRLELEDIALEGCFIFVKAVDMLVIYPWFYNAHQPGLKPPPVVAFDIERSSWNVLEESFEGVFVPNFMTLP